MIVQYLLTPQELDNGSLGSTGGMDTSMIRSSQFEYRSVHSRTVSPTMIQVTINNY